MSNRADLKDGHKIRVLLVDDNETFLRIADDFLQRQHALIVVGAICGEELVTSCSELERAGTSLVLFPKSF